MEHSTTDRPGQEEIAVASLRFPRDLWATVKSTAFDRRISAQQLCIDAVREFLKPAGRKGRA